MFPTQLKDYGSKVWLIQLDTKPHIGGRLIMARTRGRNGTLLQFASREKAEEFIENNPNWGDVSTKAPKPAAAGASKSKGK